MERPIADPEGAFRLVIEKARAALVLMDRHDLNDLRSEICHLVYGATRIDRQPQPKELRAACKELLVALKEMGYNDPIEAIQKLEDEFTIQPSLENMQKAIDRPPYLSV